MNRRNIFEEHKLIRQTLIKFAQEVLGRFPETFKEYAEYFIEYMLESNIKAFSTSYFFIL